MSPQHASPSQQQLLDLRAALLAQIADYFGRPEDSRAPLHHPPG